MQQHLPFFGLHTLAKLPHCKLSPPHLNWLLAAPACGAFDSNISAADSVTISIRMVWLPSPAISQPMSSFMAEPVTARAREYLATVFEDRENVDIADRMEAAQITRKFEAKKIAPQTVHMTRRDEADRREAWREYEIRRRKMDLVKATRQQPPPGWADDLRSPDYLPPPGNDWPPGREQSGRLRLVYDREKERG